MTPINPGRCPEQESCAGQFVGFGAKSRLITPYRSRTDAVAHATIEVRVRELGQIFNSLDPSPFTERDLDDDAEAYIVGWAREVDRQVGLS